MLSDAQLDGILRANPENSDVAALVRELRRVRRALNAMHLMLTELLS